MNYFLAIDECIPRHRKQDAQGCNKRATKLPSANNLLYDLYFKSH